MEEKEIDFKPLLDIAATAPWSTDVLMANTLFDQIFGGASLWYSDGICTMLSPAEDGAATERARIRTALEAMKPGEAPYTRKSWNDELIGERRMWARVMAVIDGPAKGGE